LPAACATKKFNKSAGNKFSYQQGLEQLSPHLHSREPAAKGNPNRCKFGTFGDAHDTPYDGRNNNELQKVNK
jgi:hypothetical protein